MNLENAEHVEWRTTFRAGLLTWPALRREIEHACVAAGVTRRHLKVKWRGLSVVIDIALAGEQRCVRRMARFVDDLAAQA